jgi:zinc transport system substrate-binding protein
MNLISRAALLRCLPFVACGLALLTGCGQRHEISGHDPKYAITTSWLECALKDVTSSTMQVIRLCSPGTCPGHFDISPGNIKGLQASEALVLFDFQKALDQKLERLTVNGLRVVSIHAPEGLCVPDSYLEACRELSDSLMKGATGQNALPPALEQTRKRLEALETNIRGRIHVAGLGQAKVVASGHQAVFCRWLGLDVIAAYSGGEAATPAQLEKLIKQGKDAGVRFVIANLQEGKQAGEALAWQLGARLVTFSNFPSMQPEQDTFDELLEYNLQQLLAAAGASS